MSIPNYITLTDPKYQQLSRKVGFSLKNVMNFSKMQVKITRALDIRNVITTGRSFVLNTSEAECSASATPCLPSQPASTLSFPIPMSRIYSENKVERDS